MASSKLVSKIPSLLDISLDDISDGLDQGLFTSVDLVNAYTARINEVNDELRAVIEVNPDALRIAETLDKERAIKGRRGPLHGVPLFLKGNIVTLDKMNGTAGSYALLGSRPPREAKVAAKLREAGAIILGLANLSEWSNIRSSNYTAGWSPRGGYTKGIYYPGMNPQGSSSGPAVTSGLGLAFASIGAETDGSLTLPAAASNVVGIKPTVGLVSRDCAIPISNRQDTLGPLARSVRDAAHILTAIAGRDEYDTYTSKIPFEKTPNYAESCTSKSLHGIRLGIPRNAFSDSDKDVMEAFEKAVEVLKSIGTTIVDNANFTGLDTYNSLDSWSQVAVLFGDFKDSMASYLDSLTTNPENLHTIQDLLDWTHAHPEEGYPEYDTKNFELATKGDTTSKEYKEILEKQAFIGVEGGVPGAIKRDYLDALIAPSPYNTMTHFTAMEGLPMITLPMGYYPEGTNITWDKSNKLIETAPGIPFGLCIAAGAFSEQTLIRIAYAFEQSTLFRAQIKPYITPPTDLEDVLSATHKGVGGHDKDASQHPIELARA